MTHLIWLAVYLTGFFIAMALGTRVFYGVERRTNPDGKVLASYQMAVLEGAVCGLLWPVALPLLVIFAIGWQVARMVAPSEVRREVTAYNTAMMERMLGQKDVDFERRYSLGVGEHEQ